MNQIKVENISKRYGDVRALDDVSLIFKEQTIYGLLGRNGAGKTTLLNVMAGRVFAEQGRVTVDGAALGGGLDVSPLLFMMGEKNMYPEYMRVREAFLWASRFFPYYDGEYCDDLLRQFRLDTRKKIKALSTGYRSIFKLIMALSVNTPYLLLDEPVLGLDANHRDLFYRLLLEKYNKQPFTVIISTHLIEEVSNIIEQVVIIDAGHILVDENRDHLLAKGYTVSGKASEVDVYTDGLQVIGSDSIGGLKSAYVLGDKNLRPLTGSLEINPLDLQKLFVELTNERRSA